MEGTECTKGVKQGCIGGMYAADSVSLRSVTQGNELPGAADEAQQTMEPLLDTSFSNHIFYDPTG